MCLPSTPAWEEPLLVAANPKAQGLGGKAEVARCQEQNWASSGVTQRRLEETPGAAKGSLGSRASEPESVNSVIP